MIFDGTSDRFVFSQELYEHDTINGFSSGSVMDFSLLVGASTYEGEITDGDIDANSVGWIYDASNDATYIFVDTSSAAQAVTGTNDGEYILALQGNVALTEDNFSLWQA